MAQGQDGVGPHGGVVDVVQDQDHGPAQLVGGRAQTAHHLRGVGHVQVVEGLVQEDVGRVLGQHHGHEGPLTLPPAHLVQAAGGQGLQVHPLDGLLHRPVVRLGGPSPVVGEPAEGHQVTHGQADRELVVLAQHGHGAGELAGVGAADVQAADRHGPGVGPQQAGDNGQQRGLARPVGADEAGDAARGQVHGNVVEDQGASVGLGDLVDGDHECLPSRTRRVMSRSPPRSSTMTDRTVDHFRTCWSTVWPPTRVRTAHRADAGRVTPWW